MNKGFTLIELIAVIVVIVILAAIALPRVGDMRSAALASKKAANISVVKTAIERAITEGELTSGNTASLSKGWLTSHTSTLTGVPYIVSDADLSDVTIAGTYPDYTVN